MDFNFINSQHSLDHEEYKKLQEENKPFMILFKVCALVVFLTIIIVTVYRYSLIGKAIDRQQYVTALALTSPEIGTGVGAVFNSIF